MGVDAIPKVDGATVSGRGGRAVVAKRYRALVSAARGGHACRDAQHYGALPYQRASAGADRAIGGSAAGRSGMPFQGTAGDGIVHHDDLGKRRRPLDHRRHVQIGRRDEIGRAHV